MTAKHLPLNLLHYGMDKIFVSFVSEAMNDIRQEPSRQTLYDLQVAAGLIAGGLEGVKKTIPLLMKDCEKHLQLIHAALQQQDARQLERSAHTIKGAAEMFGAEFAATAARQLEEAARENNLQPTTELVAQLQTEIERLRAALQRELPV